MALFCFLLLCAGEKADGEEQKTNGNADASEAKDTASEEKLAEQLGDLSVKDSAGGDTSTESDKKDTEKSEEKD